MNEKNEKLLNHHGWEVECFCPFEISTKDGSFATNEAAHIVLEYFKLEQRYNRLYKKHQRLKIKSSLT